MADAFESPDHPIGAGERSGVWLFTVTTAVLTGVLSGVVMGVRACVTLDVLERVWAAMVTVGMRLCVSIGLCEQQQTSSAVAADGDRNWHDALPFVFGAAALSAPIALLWAVYTVMWKRWCCRPLTFTRRLRADAIALPAHMQYCVSGGDAAPTAAAGDRLSDVLPLPPVIPPRPYPNGWYRLCGVADLPSATGAVSSHYAFGRRIIAFRTVTVAPAAATAPANAPVAVMDAQCPHMGSDLSGGLVMTVPAPPSDAAPANPAAPAAVPAPVPVAAGASGRMCIQCPHHGWCFDAVTGKCVSIPGVSAATVARQSARVRPAHIYPVRLVADMVLVWYSAAADDGADDAAAVAQTWEPHAVPDFPSLRAHGCTTHYVYAHVQDIPENGADTAHLDVLHRPSPAGAWLPALEHAWHASWAVDPDRWYAARVQVRTSLALRLCGRRRRTVAVPGSAAVAHIQQMGPALVYERIATPLGLVWVVESVLPLAPRVQRVVHTVYGAWSVPRPVAKLALTSFAVQFERDVPVWNRKTWHAKPLLVKGDGPIAAYRRWFRHFYG